MTLPSGGAPPDGGALGQPPAPPPAPVGTPPETAAPSHQDWNAMAKTQRDLFGRIDGLAKVVEQLATVAKTPSAPPEAQTLTQRVESLMARLDAQDFASALEKSFVAAKIPEGPIRDLIAQAAKGQKPDELRAFVAQYATVGGPPPAAPTTPGAPPRPAVVVPVPPPAPGPGSTGGLPENPLQWPPEIVEKMSVADYRKALAEHDAKRGGGNPFKALRRR